MNERSPIDLSGLIAVSRRYGADPAFVLAGGGNTSIKDGDRLWVKASGHALATIGTDGFVELDRTKLDAMLHRSWPTDATAREAAFVEAVMAARVHPHLGQRPSVEALLHHLIPNRFVVHTHPGLVNALTCCVRGETLAGEFFGDRVLWQPYVDPGLTLAQRLEISLKNHRACTGHDPEAIFLANHGLIVGGDLVEDIDRVYTGIIAPIRTRLQEDSAKVPVAQTNAQAILQTYTQLFLERQSGLVPVSDCSGDVLSLVSTKAGRDAALAGPLTPDQIVYCRSVPLWIESPVSDPTQAARDVEDAWEIYAKAYGMEPWVVVLNGVGIIALQTTAQLSEITRSLYVDAANIYLNAARLGGVRVLSQDQRRFIEDWEVEAYRRSIMAGKDQPLL